MKVDWINLTNLKYHFTICIFNKYMCISTTHIKIKSALKNQRTFFNNHCKFKINFGN